MEIVKPDDSFNDKKRAWLERLAALIQRTAADLVAMAQIVHEIDEEGLDPNEVLAVLKLGPDFIGNLRLIHEKRLDAKFFTVCGHKKKLIAAMSRLSSVDSGRIVEEKSVAVVVYDHKGNRDLRNVPLEDLNDDQIRQVFAGNHLRTEGEQHRYLDHEAKEKQEAIPSFVGVLRMDEEKDGVWHGRTFIPRADLKTAIRELEKKKAS